MDFAGRTSFGAGTFDHAYRFEAADGINFDGGVIEISSDDGETWTDVAEAGADPGYSGPITGDANPLFTRLAYVGESPGWPARAQQQLDFGPAFAGRTVRLRFRIATDTFTGAPGWELDDLAFAGIIDTPFSRWTVDAGHCAAGTTGDTGDPPTTGDGAGQRRSRTMGAAGRVVRRAGGRQLGGGERQRGQRERPRVDPREPAREPSRSSRSSRK
jgi:hypothetical protein